MRIDGAWCLCDDEVVRPVINCDVLTGTGGWLAVPFQVDIGADCTVLNARTLRAVDLQQHNPHEQLGGVGGAAASVLVETQIRLKSSDRNTIVFKARFAAFTDPEALDMSVLGRDITNLFALIVDRPGAVVCLLGQRHRYVIEQV